MQSTTKLDRANAGHSAPGLCTHRSHPRNRGSTAAVPRPTFHLTDSQSGLLFFLYFAGSSLGALLCRRSYARSMAIGFVAAAASAQPLPSALAIVVAAFLLLGISVGIPMSAVSLLAGRNFAELCAAPHLSQLQLECRRSPGAAVRGWLLLHHSYRFAYAFSPRRRPRCRACCLLAPRWSGTAPDKRRDKSTGLPSEIVAFAVAAFLQVGVENTAAAWLPTYALRTSATMPRLCGHHLLALLDRIPPARGASAFILFASDPHTPCAPLLRSPRGRIATVLAPANPVRGFAMFLLGVGLAPIYPLVVAGILARAQHTSDARWVLASAGFGGSVLPWLAGTISAHIRAACAQESSLSPPRSCLCYFSCPLAAQQGAANQHTAKAPTVNQQCATAMRRTQGCGNTDTSTPEAASL